MPSRKSPTRVRVARRRWRVLIYRPARHRQEHGTEASAKAARGHAGRWSSTPILSEFLLLTKEVEISDFLVSVAGAMSEQVAGSPTAHRRGIAATGSASPEFMQSQGRGQANSRAKLPGLDIKAALKSDPDFKRRVQEAARGHVAQLASEAHDFLSRSGGLRSPARGQIPARKVVLLIDSVERIRGVGREAMSGLRERSQPVFRAC
jgi:hypothetical protein